jgi:arsenate reductase
MVRERVLFVCIHNSARSQMAEAWMNHLFGNRYEAKSAGIEPGTLNPLAVTAMREAKIDMSGKATHSVWEFYQAGETFSYVVTVCDAQTAASCPLFPGSAIRMHWNVPDPSAVQGSEDEKLAAMREVRDAIRQKVEQFCENP